MMPDIEEDTDNGLPSEEYKAWYNLVSHPIIHNVANPPKDILQPHNQEEEDVVSALEPQYIMRPRGYENQLVSAVQTSTIILAEALTLRQKRIENLQREYHDEGVLDEAGHDGVGESSRAVEDLAPSTQPAVEEPRRYNSRKK
ncbi:hypothetical protein AMTR_s00161p00040380 [Amborella trichopoda]|uniref:Uncharacterized protein n=1 Tax=Amborella trichopoda TaxID=13333 RepID=W1PRK8_AMBTC|nr:hypothetical protein AMTR_s00161p00040380 [Amborella trichopoda]